MQSFASRSITVASVLLLVVFALMSVAVGAPDNHPGPAYSFVYLGDMHFDKVAHHDFEWVKANKPNDIRQIEGYVKNTETYTPGLLRRIQTSIESSQGRIRMVIQGGDLVEGLCGTRELQELQFKDVREVIQDYLPKTPFVACKGNHDITGPGAKEAYDNVMLPWLSHECGKTIDSASFFFMQGPDLFVFVDAYHRNGLDWLEKTLSTNPYRRAFVVMHPPAVPYNARSTWHLFSKDTEKDVRERFLRILGEHKVVLLTGHLHKYHVLVRKTSTGAFTQFSMSSVLASPAPSVKNHVEGLEKYGPSMVELEPEFQPASRAQREHILEDEKPYIKHFEFADFPGYAIINVSDAEISADIYVGDSDKRWKRIALSPARQDD